MYLEHKLSPAICTYAVPVQCKHTRSPDIKKAQKHKSNTSMPQGMMENTNTPRTEINPHDLLHVSSQRYDSTPGSQIPNSSERIETRRCYECTVSLKRNRVDCARVSLLAQQLLLRFKVPKAPCLVERCRAQELQQRVTQQISQ